MHRIRSIFLLSLLLAFAAGANQIRLAWDPSPDGWVAGYYIYASTNSFGSHQLTNAPNKVDAGTNCTLTVSNLTRGLWYFVATAYCTNGLESLPSNEVVAGVETVPPANLRTVVLEWNAVVATTNWQDAGFFRVKLGL